jgi:hypothetical protein
MMSRTLQGGCKCSEESSAPVGLHHAGDWGGLFLWSLNCLQDCVLSWTQTTIVVDVTFFILLKGGLEMCVICVVCALCLVLIMKSFCCRLLVDVLHQWSVPVYLISGGLRGVITPVVLELNITLQNIYASWLKFFFNGKWLRVYFEETFLLFFFNLCQSKCLQSVFFDHCPWADSFLP